MKVVVPRFQGTDDCKEFSIVDVIVPLGKGERLGKVGAWMPITIRIGLEEDST